jgi:myo-inositol-1(or 4)-monophosphatase
MPAETPEFAVALQAAYAGGEVISRYFRYGVIMRSKESYNLVSDADVESEAVIASTIRGAFPTHAILGEESNHDDISSPDLWIIDPLDGTNNFAHGIPQFSVSIAYVKNGVTMLGVVFNPLRNDLYRVERGAGAYHNDKPASVSTESSLDQTMISFGVYYDRGQMMEKTLDCLRELYGMNIHGTRRMGAASLDLCMIGTGQFGAHFEYQLAPWDFAAGALFLEEAGGMISSSRGAALPFETTGVLASNGLLHQQMLDIVLRHHP